MENWERRFDRVQPPDSSVPSHREALRKRLQSDKIPARHHRRTAAALGITMLVTLGALTLGYPSWAKALWNTVFVQTTTLHTKDGHTVVIKRVPLEYCEAVCDTSARMLFCETGGRRAIAFKQCLPGEGMSGDSFSISTEAILKQLDLSGKEFKNITISTPDGENTWIVNGDTIDANNITRSVDRLPETSSGPDWESLEPKDIASAPNAAPEINADFDLHQNYPNPFNPTTQISFELKQGGTTTLKVYNLMGQEVATLVNGYTDAGHHTVTFDGANLPSGSYLYTLRTANFQTSKMMKLTK